MTNLTNMLDALDDAMRRCLLGLIEYRAAVDAWQHHRTTVGQRKAGDA